MTKNISLLKFSKKNYSLCYIRSFVSRKRKLTKKQQYALDNYWPMIGVEFNEQILNFPILFKSNAPVVLEIGFGNGSSLISMANSFPKLNFLGIEVYLPGISVCLDSTCNEYKEKIKNLRIICHDAVEVLQKMISNNSLSVVQIFFPDPWNKKRHNKRRIIQIPFVELIRKKLKLGGTLHVVTDCKNYAQHILETISSLGGYKNQYNNSNYILHSISRPITKFEQRSRILGYSIWDFMFEKISL